MTSIEIRIVDALWATESVLSGTMRTLALAVSIDIGLSSPVAEALCEPGYWESSGTIPEHTAAGMRLLGHCRGAGVYESNFGRPVVVVSGINDVGGCHRTELNISFEEFQEIRSVAEVKQKAREESSVPIGTFPNLRVVEYAPSPHMEVFTPRRVGPPTFVNPRRG